MKYIIRLLLAVVLTALWSCENDGLEVNDIRDIEVPEGFVLSAGTSTVFKNSSYAYDTDANWVASIPANEKPAKCLLMYPPPP